MEEIEISDGIELEEERHQTGRLNFLGYVPPTLRYTFRQGLNNVLKSHRMETGINLRGLSTMTCPNATDDEFEGIWKVPCIDDFPDALISAGFGDFFRKEFVERFVNKEYFKNAWKGPVNRLFAETGLVDPDGFYTMYSVTPYLMLVDKKRLGDLPVPRRWSDLLDPRYRDKIIMPGADALAWVPLFYFHKEYGFESLTRLAVNTKAIWQSIEMARLAGSSRSEAAIYVTSWLFARSCPREDTAVMVWPEDGALANPIFMLVKKEKIEELAPVLEYALGAEVGREYAQSCYPVANPEVDNGLPEGATFKWIGWDYLRSHDLDAVREEGQAIFASAWNEAHPEVTR